MTPHPGRAAPENGRSATAFSETALSESAFRAHERLLWGLSYRVTGVAADADEVVQDTFLRLLERPPEDLDRPVRPWLVRVCVNLSRDRLRKRRRKGYRGPWLPSPVPDEQLDLATPEAQVGASEGVSTAFLLAMEALTPQQRAVLVLRDVFELSGEETAEALGSTAAAVRIAHHRARRALAGRGGSSPSVAERERTAAALVTFLTAIASGDIAGACAMLAPEVTLVSDANGEFKAAGVVVRGPERIVRFIAGFDGSPEALRWAVIPLNGLPSLVGEVVAPGHRQAPRFAMGISLDAEGRIAGITWVLATRKLSAVGPLPGGTS